MRALLGGLKVLVLAVLVNALANPMGLRLSALAEAAPAPGYDVPGFGGATAPPRMLIIMDTSKSMSSTPDSKQNLPLQDYDGEPDSTMSPPICGEDPNTIAYPNSGGLSAVPGIPNQATGGIQGSTVTLSCPAGQHITQIDWAAYGKRTNTVGGNAQTPAVSNFTKNPPCSMATLDDMTDNTNIDGAGTCDLSQSTQTARAGVSGYRGWIDIKPKIQALCVGLGTCSFLVDDALAGDPCYGTGFGKYALTSFRCSSDPCPPGSGSKFCIAKKALHRVVSDNAANTLEMAAGGYFQTQWSQVHPATPASYVTDCAYDVIAKSSTTTNQSQLTLQSDDEFGTVGTPSAPATTVNFSCNPEAMTGVSPSAYPAGCTPQPSSHACTKSYSDSIWGGPRYQHDNPVFRNTVPTGGPGTWFWGAGGTPADRLTDVPKRYFSSVNSAWDDTNLLLVRAADIGGTCAAGPATFADVPNSLPPAASTWPGTCTPGNPCTFFNRNNSRQLDIDNTNIYFNAGSPPQLVRGLTRNFVQVTLSGNVNLPVTEFGSTCPATPTYTGTLGFSPACGPGDDRCTLNRVGSTDVPNVSYTCSYPFSLNTPTTCQNTVDAYNSSVSVPGYTQDTSADSWAPFDYNLDLAAVATGTVSCFDGEDDTWTADRFPLATAGLQSFVTGLGCGSNDTAFPGRCAVKGISPLFTLNGNPTRGVLSSDGNSVICKMARYRTHYKSTVPATANQYCTYNRNIYRWYNQETRCEYHRFDYGYTKKAFYYTWKYNDGDYAGSVDGSPAYSSAATTADQYCSVTRPGSPLNPSYDSTNGFTVPSGTMKCAAELAPGTNGCPSDARRCKLRWGSPGNKRFEYFSQNTFQHPRLSSVQPKIGCAVGDPMAQASADINNLSDYSTNWGDWCWTDPSKQPAHSQTTDAPKLIADLYDESVNGLDFTANYWDGAHPNASGIDVFAPMPHAKKDRGLSVSQIYPPTPAVSFGDFSTPKTDLLKMFMKYGAGGGTVGLQMPTLGNITPLTGALKNAIDFLNQTKAADPSASCRRYSILLVTDGDEDPAVIGGLDTQADAAKAAGINVYVVGFGIQSATLDNFTRRVGTAVDSLGIVDNVNGHAYNASDYTSLLSALNQIIGAQLNGFYTRSKPTLTTDAKRMYAGYFAHATGGAGPLEYAGYVDAYAVTTTGVNPTPDWKFDSKLNNQTSAPSSTLPRHVMTRIPNTNALGEFDIATSCTGPSLALVEGITGPGTCATQMAAANTIIEYVRNDRLSPDNATFSDGTNKVSRVSDVYHSQPTSMYAPFFSSAYTSPTPYVELGGRGSPIDPAAATADFDSGAFTASYSAYKALNTSRETTVFVGSNTGTVHAIRDDVAGTQSWRGQERWAYVPKQLLPNLGNARTSGHTWLVDGSFGLSEVCFGKADCENPNGLGWKAILVGTTGRGGPFLFALDVTDPANPAWLWDYNNGTPDSQLGETWSAPVIARVRVDDDYYKWGVFMGAGYQDAPAQSDYFYVLDADPASRDSSHNTQPLEDSHHKKAKFQVASSNQVYSPWPFTHTVENNVPARPRVIRPNDGSRASRVYFGDTNGVLWQANVTSKKIDDWQPTPMFNPFKQNAINSSASNPADCRASSINELPDHGTGTTSMSSSDPSLPTPTSNLPALYNRPYIGLDENTSATLLYVGSGDATNPLDMSTQNYFWAIEDTGSLETGNNHECVSKVRWAYYLNKATGEKVLSEPAIIGKNIIVAVYTPPTVTANMCGAAGTSMLYCFDRLTGVPQNCLVDLSTTPADSTAAAFGGKARFVRVGQPGILSDLQAVGNKIIFTSSAAPDHPGSIDASDLNTPLRVKSWKRVR